MKLVLGMEVGLSPGDSVLDGDPTPSSPKGAEPPPQFSANFYCGQRAGCIKMPLCVDVGLSPGDFVLDGDPVPLPKRGCSPQIFGLVYSFLPYSCEEAICLRRDSPFVF